MPARRRAEVFIQPKGRAPLKKTAIVNYANAAELRKQIEAYALGVWPTARKIIADTGTQEIIVDGTALANYALHTPRDPKPAASAMLALHTTAQLAVVALGLTLTSITAGRINGLYLTGFALAVFGIYRLALGIQRREATR